MTTTHSTTIKQTSIFIYKAANDLDLDIDRTDAVVFWECHIENHSQGITIKPVFKWLHLQITVWENKTGQDYEPVQVLGTEDLKKLTVHFSAHHGEHDYQPQQIEIELDEGTINIH